MGGGGRILVPVLPIMSHMNLSFPVRTTETLIIPVHERAGPPRTPGPWGAPYSVTLSPEQSCEVGGWHWAPSPPHFLMGMLGPRELGAFT